MAGYSILGWPSLYNFLSLPLWVWLAFANMLCVAINQGISQKVRSIDPLVHNFWGGAVTVVFAGLTTLIISPGFLIDFSPSIQKLWLASAVIGFVVIGMWSFNILAYKGGASIAIKKLVMYGSYLITVTILGILIFGEQLTMAKIFGMVLYVIAFVLMNNEAREFFVNRLFIRQAESKKV